MFRHWLLKSRNIPSSSLLSEMRSDARAFVAPGRADRKPQLQRTFYMANNHHNHRTSKPSAAKSLREVEFCFESATAKTVHLAGDFNKWATDSLPLRKDSSGHWRVRVPLAPGPHQYRFVVDGLWVDDPSACSRQANPFGSCNCEVVVQ